MYRFIEYLIFFIILVLLQTFLFDNLNLGLYVRPLVYVAFLVLLPFRTPAVVVLLCALAMGLATDLFSGGAGLNVIACVATGAFRTLGVRITTSAETIREGGVPSPQNMGTVPFLSYSAVMILFHSLVFFSFETLSLNHYWLTLLRVVASSGVTLVLFFGVRLLMPSLYLTQAKD